MNVDLKQNVQHTNYYRYKLNKNNCYITLISTIINQWKIPPDIFEYFLRSDALCKKSRIRETKNLSTDADSRTDTILERLHDR